MAQKTNIQLQQFFQTGDIPSQQNYFDLLDSYINLIDETNTASTFKLMDNENRGILQTPVGRLILGDALLPIDLQSNVTASGYITAGNITASGDISSSGTLFGGGLNINGTTTFNDGDITNVGTIDVDFVRADTSILDFINLGTNNITTVINGTNTFIVKPKIIEIGTSGVNAHVTASGNISASGTVFANEFNIANISSSATIVGTNFATNPTDGKYIFDGIGGQDYIKGTAGTNIEIATNNVSRVIVTNATSFITNNLDVTGNFKAGGSNISLEDLPTSDPSSAGRLFTQTAAQLGGSGTTRVICVSEG